jgi:transcriptional regulator with XRE-family HTH domain
MYHPEFRMALSMAIGCLLGVRGRDIFGRNLRYYRLQADLSQEELAHLLGVNPARISDWERGVHGCSIDAVANVADALHVPMTALVDEATPIADVTKAPRKSEAARLPRPRATTKRAKRRD